MKQDESEEIDNLVLRELENFKKQKEKDGKAIAKVLQAVETFDEKMTSKKTVPLETDLSPVKELIKEQNLRIQAMIAAIPKVIKREYHFHFFPKINIKEYYQTYSRLLFYGTIFLFAAGLVNIGWEWIKGYNQRQDYLEQIEALKQNEEIELQLELKRNKSKPDVSRSVEAIRTKTANDKIAFKKKQLMDSIKARLEKKIDHYLNDSLHK
jgi:hypothetical protein